MGDYIFPLAQLRLRRWPASHGRSGRRPDHLESRARVCRSSRVHVIITWAVIVMTLSPCVEWLLLGKMYESRSIRLVLLLFGNPNLSNFHTTSAICVTYSSHLQTGETLILTHFLRQVKPLHHACGYHAL
jgi:hypothetical protein